MQCFLNEKHSSGRYEMVGAAPSYFPPSIGTKSNTRHARGATVKTAAQQQSFLSRDAIAKFSHCA
jgi:hypothetical protein